MIQQELEKLIERIKIYEEINAKNIGSHNFEK